MFKPAIMPLIMLLACPVEAGQDARLLDQLRVDHGVLKAAERDFRQYQDQGNPGPTEIHEYAAFVNRLRQRVITDCIALEAAQMEVPADIDCPKQQSPVARPAAIDQQAERTDAEQAAALDAELNAGLGEFDQLLLREQERVKLVKPVTADGGSQEDADSAAGGGRSGDLRGNGAPGSTDEPPENSDLSAPSPVSGAAGSQPKDVPDESDDDVVARQLREAAERETDPELKKKLWEEYRKYKQGVR